MANSSTTARYELDDFTTTSSNLKKHFKIEDGFDFVSVYPSNFDINEIKIAISTSNYVQKYNIIPEIIDIILNYIEIVKFSQTYKSSNIELINSNDNSIEYAILNQKTEKNGNIY